MPLPPPHPRATCTPPPHPCSVPGPTRAAPPSTRAAALTCAAAAPPTCAAPRRPPARPRVRPAHLRGHIHVPPHPRSVFGPTRVAPRPLRGGPAPRAQRPPPACAVPPTRPHGHRCTVGRAIARLSVHLYARGEPKQPGQLRDHGPRVAVVPGDRPLTVSRCRGGAAQPGRPPPAPPRSAPARPAARHSPCRRGAWARA
jgi:hypothetical protein